MAAGQSGIDVSHYQGDIDWQAVAGAGISFAYLKATEGTGYSDTTFAGNWAGCQDAAIASGAYHYFLPRDSFLQQAENFVSALKSVGYDRSKDLPPAIDCEEMDGSSPAEYVHALGSMTHLLEKLLWVKPMIYTSPGFWNGLGNPDFSQYPLWLAEYTSAPQPNVPAPWSAYTIWQYSQKGQVSGISGYCDSDISNPNLALGPFRGSILNWF
ncbi:glycoside hydrolase family 25 protein [Roseibium sp. RKSG952]|uniref:glycoside hydrolase family 25 protein n=1 Tax=Roseibium sp. RKSG952 TaxID=2529384 RepID=UPI0012BC5431|nr:GH25 family lysozyme [Roseibium sp. RKSG952]MTI00309.1 glycosyl hydrolase family 25 [Roseibium sp. RKSG952]